MSTKTKIIVIRKSQLAFGLVILVIALLLAGLLISAIVTQTHKESHTESDTTTSSDAADSSDTSTASGTAESSGTTATSGLAISSALYTPGIYTSTVILNDTTMEVQVVVDANHINSISLVNLDESVATSYPLVQPAIEDLAGQIISSQSIDDVSYSASNQYTSMVLYGAICDALDKAYTD